MTDKINLSCGASLPIGSVVPFMGVTAPQDFLACDGTVYNISDYPALAAEFESEYGTKNHFGGDGVTTFAVPTLTGAPTGSIFVIKSQNSPSSGLIDYSTSERVVGTWIDGSILYEKTIVKPLDPIAANTVSQIALDSDLTHKLIKCDTAFMLYSTAAPHHSPSLMVPDTFLSGII